MLKKQGKITKKWLTTRKQWFKLHNEPYYTCNYCHKWLTKNETTLDHVKSRSRHPELRFDLDNLVPCCYKCNYEKGSKDA